MADDELKVVATALNEAEADLMRLRLQDGGIHAITRRTTGSAEWGGSGARYVLVAERDLASAQEMLDSDEGVSEHELARLSEEAGRETGRGEPDA